MSSGDKEVVSQEEAVDIARAACLPPRSAFEVLDGVPDDAPIYASLRREPCWCIRVPRPEPPMIGSTHLILVSKETSKVLFDGPVGE
jgi:hypothetical protein